MGINTPEHFEPKACTQCGGQIHHQDFSVRGMCGVCTEESEVAEREMREHNSHREYDW